MQLLAEPSAAGSSFAGPGHLCGQGQSILKKNDAFSLCMQHGFYVFSVSNKLTLVIGIFILSILYKQI